MQHTSHKLRIAAIAFGARPAILCSLLSAVSHASTSPGGQWEALAATVEARAGHGMAQIGDVVYIAGGWDSTTFQGALDSVEVYEPSTSSWALVASMPEGRLGSAVVACQGKLYVIGGTRPGGEEQQTVFAFDPPSATWTSAAPLPSRRTFAAAIEYDDMIYVFGGTSGGAALATTVVFDPSQNAWETRAPMPTARSGLAAASFGSYVFLIGGEQVGTKVLSVCERYDPSSDQWSSKKSMPHSNAYAAVATSEGRIFSFGGIHAASLVRVYDPLADDWSVGPLMPSARWALTAIAYDHRILVVGGFDEALQPTHDAHAFIPNRAAGVEPFCFCERGDPCTNEFSSGGCKNNQGVGALLEATGTVSIDADDLIVNAINIPPLAGVVAILGTREVFQPFGNGLQCAGGKVHRAPLGASDASGNIALGPGIIASSDSALFAPGRTVVLQFAYRDFGGPCGFGWNSTNALAATFAP